MDIAYSTSGMRHGAGLLAQVSDDATNATTALQNAPLAAVMFGLTDGATTFATALESARTAQARGFTQEAARSSGLAEGTGAAADLGDGLDAEAAEIARGGTPGGS